MSNLFGNSTLIVISIITTAVIIIIIVIIIIPMIPITCQKSFDVMSPNNTEFCLQIGFGYILQQGKIPADSVQVISTELDTYH